MRYCRARADAHVDPTPADPGALRVAPGRGAARRRAELLFVRVSGCNLRCTWCDSPATSWAPTGTPLGLDALVDFCARGPRHVVLTGGEPLLFPRGRAAEPAPARRRASCHGRDRGHRLAAGARLRFCCRCRRSWPTAPRGCARRSWPSATSRPASTSRCSGDCSPASPGSSSSWSAPPRRPPTSRRSRRCCRRWLCRPASATGAPITPECVDPAALPGSYRTLVGACIERGFRLGERLHIALFGHTPGT